MIKWDTVDQRTVNLAYLAMSRIITPSNYGTDDGQWTLTELLQTDLALRYHAYKILDGVDAQCNRPQGLAPLTGDDGHAYKFRFRVNTRQACVRTKDGQKIFASREAHEDAGGDGILPDHLAQPEPGDIVEWKGQFRRYDSEKGREVDGKVLKEWAMRGIRPETYIDYVVDKDGCIEVPYPYALAMLTRKGKSLAYPRFTKQKRGKKVTRRITNWWFEEVSQNYRKKK